MQIEEVYAGLNFLLMIELRAYVSLSFYGRSIHLILTGTN